MSISITSGIVNREILIEGWLYKKRRKKTQGFASRYFRLYSSGILSYSIHPSIGPRDQILLSSAVVSSFNTSPCDVHIDSDHSTFHIKFKSISESQKWMPLFRKFFRSSLDSLHPSTPNEIVRAMGSSITELKSSLLALKQLDAGPKPASFSLFKRGDSSGHFSNVLRDKESRLNKIFKNEYSLPLSGTSSSNDLVNSEISLDRITKAVQEVSTQYQSLVSYLAHEQQQQACSQNQPSHLPAESQALMRRSTLRFRNLSAHSIPLGSDGSIWFDAEDSTISAGEILLDSEPVYESITPEESIAPTSTPVEEIIGDDSRNISLSTSTDNNAIHQLSHHMSFERRSVLPAPMCGDEGSLFVALKKNIGKDLSTVSFPVSFNEPLSLLQRLCEDTEYTNLLELASDSNDHIERICYVAAFAVSGYSGTKLRSGRKSFTPMMAETFEDKRCNFIAEKVSHSPLIMVCHARGDGWEYWSTSAGKTRFWGRSLEIAQTGTANVRLGQDHYSWQRPSTFVRNLVMGSKYLEHCGQVTITSPLLTCILDFKESGYWGTTPNVVSGKVIDTSQNVVAILEGRWDEQLNRILDTSHFKVLWKADPFPQCSLEYYGFSSFAMALNEMTPDLDGKLPPSDSRFRSDIRAMEEGNIGLADDEKIRLETQQRLWREQQDPRIHPKWFKLDERSGEYVYKGGYWEQREIGWNESVSWWSK